LVCQTLNSFGGWLGWQIGSKPSAAQTSEEVDAMGKIGLKAVLRFFIIVLLQMVVLFIAAGSVNWPMAWAYVAMVLVFTVASRLLVMRKYPDLIRERAASLDRQDVQAGDKLLLGLIAIYGPLVVHVVAGLNHRFGWSGQFPLGLQWVAFAVAVGGILLGTWAMLENCYFSAVVRIQKDRHQTVVTSGPYRLVRHPSYLGGIATFRAIPVVLSALWAFVPVALIVAGYIIRTVLEDRTLQAELEGYKEYAARVRCRIVPGLY
jgi:protein-S-isoprenylcysteine O-methyltransferase Ste14